MVTSEKGFSFSASAFDAEEIKGRPDCMRVELRDFFAGDGDTSSDRSYVAGITNYRLDGQVSEKRSYRPDGSLSYHEVYEYSDDGHLEAVRLFDETGQELRRTRCTNSAEIGVDERITVGPDERELERAVTKRDDAGHVLESSIFSSSGEIVAHMSLMYDEQGRPIKGKVSLGDSPECDMEMAYQANGHTVWNFQLADGIAIIQEKVDGADNRGHDESTLVINQADGQQWSSVERIEARDTEGNWTKKIVLHRDPLTQTDRPVSEVQRIITYYGED